MIAYMKNKMIYDDDYDEDDEEDRKIVSGR